MGNKSNMDEKFKFTQSFTRSTYQLCIAELQLRWPDLEGFFPEDIVETIEGIDKCDTYSFFDTTDGRGFESLKEIVRQIAFLKEDSHNNKIIEGLITEHVEQTHSHFQNLAILSIENGLLSNLEDKERVLIKELLMKALYHGKEYGFNEAIGLKGDRIYSLTPKK